MLTISGNLRKKRCASKVLGRSEDKQPSAVKRHLMQQHFATPLFPWSDLGIARNASFLRARLLMSEDDCSERIEECEKRGCRGAAEIGVEDHTGSSFSTDLGARDRRVH